MDTRNHSFMVTNVLPLLHWARMAGSERIRTDKNVA